MKAILFVLLFIVSSKLNAQIPILNSYPTATGTIYLDFDGQYVLSGVWNNGNGFTCDNPNISSATITEVFTRVSEDFKLFKLNVTTDSTVYNNAPLTQRVRIIITPTSFFAPNTSGIAYMSSFIWGDNTPAFVFANSGSSAKFIAEATSHETGHTLGCAHQSLYDDNCNLLNGYNPGQGTGEIGWAPIMGYPVDRTFTTWHNGKKTNCNNQDDIAVINSRITGGGLRDDDISNTITGATDVVVNGINVTAGGIINNSTDVDMLKFSVTQSSKINFKITPPTTDYNDNYGNVDILVRLLNNTGTTIRTYNYNDSLKVVIDTTLIAGTYYLAVDGTGNINTPSDYGSSGSFTLQGTLQTTLSLPINRLELRGNVTNKQHVLAWVVEADEPITKSQIEYATDGIHFTTLQEVDYRTNAYSYKPFTDNTVYYRMKSFLRNGSYKNSNIITLQSSKGNDKVSVLNTVINDMVLVTVTENRNYEIYDANGRNIAKGTLLTNKINQINIDATARGLYFLKTASKADITTHKLMKN
jgi:hypothetical protein